MGASMPLRGIQNVEFASPLWNMPISLKYKNNYSQEALLHDIPFAFHSTFDSTFKV
jgi:hypothetical protein